MNRRILRLAIPNILSNITVPALSLVDTILMGHLESELYLGAIAMGAAIFDFLYWAFGFLRMGTTGLTAQALGAKQGGELPLLLARGLLVALAGSLLIILLQVPIAKLSFMIMEGTEAVKTIAKEYFYIRIYAAPATIGLYVFFGWFLGMQNSKYPLILAVFINVLNIVLNLIFIKVLGMKHEGIAWATVISQYAGFGLAVFLLATRYGMLKKFFNRKDVLNLQAIKRFLSINSDIFIRTLLLLFTLNFVIAVSGAYDDRTIAVNSILRLLIMIMAFGVDGFAFAAESLVGLYKGGEKFGEMKKAIRYLFAWGMGGGIFFSLVYVIFGKAIFFSLTDHDSVAVEAMKYLPWIIAAPVIYSAAFIWDGVYLGALAPKPMRNSMAVATLLIFLPAWYFTKDIWGNHSLWFAMTLFMLTRGIALTLLSKKFIYKNQ